MKFRALVDCPTANKGEVFEAEPEPGNVLVSIGAAEVYEPVLAKVLKAAVPVDPAQDTTKKRNTYRRRDLTAEQKTDLSTPSESCNVGVLDTALRVLGLQRKAAVPTMDLSPWNTRIVHEPFAGAWQRGVMVPYADAMAHPTFWACVTLVGSDIGKIRPRIMREVKDETYVEVDSPAFSPVLRKPNSYQNRIDFYAAWIVSKLTRGNAYALKERDARGNVVALYLLDPSRVRPMVSPGGEVFYAVGQDVLAGVSETEIVVPAREMIHDRMVPALYHPLIGLPPVYAAGQAALAGLTIAKNTQTLAQNGLQIGGLLIAPGEISADNALRIKAHFDANYLGAENSGKIAVVGDGMKFEKLAAMTAVDGQIIEQLRWSDEQVCKVFHVPPYMVGVGPLPNFNNIEALTQQYYSQCLQILIEQLELSLSMGLGIGEALGNSNTSFLEVDFNIEDLIRMDSSAKVDVATKGVAGGILTPNEGRKKFGLPPVKGGDEIYLQKQNWPLDLLGSDQPAPAAPALPTAAGGEPEPEPEPEEVEEPEKALDEMLLLAAVLRDLDKAPLHG